MNRRREAILEFAASGTIPAAQIDAAAGIIRGVKFLGERSANPPPKNNEYPSPTRQKAIALLEGARVYVDHPPRLQQGETRAYREAMGVARNLANRADGVYGDWHFPPKHPLAEQVLWDAQNNPHGVGFSINAYAGKILEQNGRRIVEEISEVNSIDLVSRPATTAGLFESRTRTMKKTLKEWLLGTTKFGQDNVKKQLIEDWAGGKEPAGKPDEYKGMMAGEVEVDDEPELTADEAGVQAMCTMVEAAAKEGDWDKVKKVVAAFQKLLTEKEEEPEEEEDDTAAEESRKAKKPKGKAIMEAMYKTGMDLFADAKIAPSLTQRKALQSCTTEAEIKVLIEEAKAAPPASATGGATGGKGGQHPTSIVPGYLSGNGVTESRKPPEKSKEKPEERRAALIESLRGRN